MTNLLAALRGGHRPDAEALSSLLDGRLDAAARESLEEHVAACVACEVRLRELRDLRAMLSAMSRVEPPRSFRLRVADVEPRQLRYVPPRRASFAPYAAAAAMLVFALVLGTDLATRDGSDDGVGFGAAATARDRSVAESAADAAGGTTLTAPAPEAAAGVDGEAGTPVPDGARDDYSSASGQELEASSVEGTANDDDGTRTAFLVAEVLFGMAALGSVGWFIASRARRAKEEA